MSGTTELNEFVDALNDLIESASSHVRDPDAFLAFNNYISALVETGLPPLVAALDAGELGPETRQILEDKLVEVRELEMKARARLVWSRDFEDYIRTALSKDDQR